MRIRSDACTPSCIADLLGKPKTEPPEENIEALVNLLVTVGKELDASSRSNDFMDAYFSRLQQLSTSKKLAARLRFLCRDVMDLRKNKWVPRREKLQAKKLDEVRADAAVALGIVGGRQDENLFPEGPNGPAEDGWSVAGKKNKPKDQDGYSALTGQYVPSATTKVPSDKQRREAKRPAADAEAVPEASAAPQPAAAKQKPVAKLSAEGLTEQCEKMLAEYQGAADVAEALLCVTDIQARSPDAAAATDYLCRLAVQQVVDVSTERYAEAVAKLLSHCVLNSAISAAAVLAGLNKQLEQLEDLAIDVPMAPKLLGILLGGLLSAKALEAPQLRSACEKVADMFCRRDYAVAVLQHVNTQGSAQLAALTAANVLAEFLISDEDGEDAASLRQLFEKKGLPASLVPP